MIDGSITTHENRQCEGRFDPDPDNGVPPMSAPPDNRQPESETVALLRQVTRDLHTIQRRTVAYTALCWIQLASIAFWTVWFVYHGALK